MNEAKATFYLVLFLIGAVLGWVLVGGRDRN